MAVAVLIVGEHDTEVLYVVVPGLIDGENIILMDCLWLFQA